MTMIFGALSFCFLLLHLIASFHTSDAVLCGRSISDRDLDGEGRADVSVVECPFCTHYSCGYNKAGFGCANDFYSDCSSYRTSIEFVKSKTPEQLNYFDGKVMYVSGCKNQELNKASIKCLADKSEAVIAERNNKEPTLNDPIWYYEKPGDANSAHSYSGNSNGVIKFTGIFMAVAAAFVGLLLTQMD